MAELAVGLGVGVYNVHIVEKEEEVQARLYGGGLDHLLRAQFLRKGFEQFKRAAGLVEIVAFPRQHNQFQRYWPRPKCDRFINHPGGDKCGMVCPENGDEDGKMVLEC